VRTTATSRSRAPGRHFPRHLQWEAGRPIPVWSRPTLKAPLPGLQAGPPLVWSRPSLKAPLPGLQAGPPLVWSRPSLKAPLPGLQAGPPLVWSRPSLKAPLQEKQHPHTSAQQQELKTQPGHRSPRAHAHPYFLLSKTITESLLRSILLRVSRLGNVLDKWLIHFTARGTRS